MRWFLRAFYATIETPQLKEVFIIKLPDKITKLRKAHNWSQEDLAERLNVSRQAISRWETGTALPDAQNVLQISKLFGVTTDYLLNDDYESDRDIPAVQTVTKENEELFLKKKQQHLIAAICFTVACICWLISITTYQNYLQLGLSCACLGFCAVNAILQFTLYFKKK